MADIVYSTFKNKKVNLSKLVSFGFEQENSLYTYSKILAESGFTMTVSITEQGEISTVVTDPAANEPYTLHLSDSAVGSFVGGIRTEYEQILTDIAEKCFEPEVFKSEQAKEVIAYVRNTYGDELEYLWHKFPDNAVVRRKDNKKWYAALLTVSRQKLGIDSDEMIEILDLRMKPEDIETIVDNKKYFPGYHMNKKHWITICLDGTLPVEKIYVQLDESYHLAKKK